MKKDVEHRKVDCFLILNANDYPVVNFITVKRTIFSYEHCVLAAFSSYMYVEKWCSYEKFVRKMLMKLTPEWERENGLSECLITSLLLQYVLGFGKC